METHDIVLYSDFNQTKKWCETPHTVEFNGNKARVISNEAFSKGQKSRLNKLSKVGQTTMGNHYCLTVNGYKAFFVSTYNIPK